MLDHSSTTLKNLNFPIPYLIVSGFDILKCIFYFKNENHLIVKKSFYVDGLGLPDPGFTRQQSVTLNENLLKSFIDCILSFEYS
uniref:Uncharacterized protein n=1 Tax=Coptotermes formosanus TaxID=36987 RepID=R4UP00_COPFO|nr:hypothetical protein [Coptotermes formosanus]